MIAQSVADILGDHVKLTVEGIDRMYLNVYVPRLQTEQGVVWFFREHRGQPLPSAALMSPMSRGFVAEHEIPLVQFRKGQRKDTVMAEHLRTFGKEEGVVFVGKAQEKTPVFRTEKRRSPTTGRPYPWIVRSTAMVNHYYIYAVDRDFGPFFLKFCTYFPFNAKLCLNGHEFASASSRAKASRSRRSTMASWAAPHPRACSKFATAFAPRRLMACCASGCVSCRTRSPEPIARPATATTSRSCKRSSH
jgi:hypothetical protein